MIIKKRKMDSKFSFIFGLAVMLTLVVGVAFVGATVWDLVTSDQTADPGDTVSLLTFNVTTANTTDPGTNLNLTQVTLNITGTNFGNISSVNISDGTNDYSNNSITSSVVTIDVSQAQIKAETNFTINFTLSSDATWNDTFQTYVTAITNQSENVTYTAPPFNSSLVRVKDSVNPTISGFAKSSSAGDFIIVDYSCSDAFSGLDTCVLSSDNGLVHSADKKVSRLNCGTSYDFTVTATDNEGNSATSTESFSTSDCSTGGSSSGGGSASSSLPTKSHSFAEITSGAAAIVSNFDSEIGVREITINVNNPAQNVKIEVTKHDGKPAAVSVERSGKVYQYIQIDAENLEDGFGSAVVEFRVEKSWLQDNGLQRDEVGVSKFDESSNVWNELETEFSSEDSDYNYYDVELDSFSYFAVSEKSVVEDDTSEETGSETGESEEESDGERNLTWLWILIALVVIAGAAYFGINSRKKE
ncbi:MAG: PGF-pre-PGF domain-containing protein [Candidatus Pacearchaeota archaeon]